MRLRGSQYLNKVSEMKELPFSIFALVVACFGAYLLTTIDDLVQYALYARALHGLIAVAASTNITYFLWRKVRKPEKAKMAKVAKEEVRTEAAQLGADAPSSFRCTSCGRSITHPLRMLDFHSQRRKIINICPFCNAKAVLEGHEEEATSAEEEVKKKEKDYMEVEVRKKQR